MVNVSVFRTSLNVPVALQKNQKKQVLDFHKRLGMPPFFNAHLKISEFQRMDARHFGKFEQNLLFLSWPSRKYFLGLLDADII